MKTVVPKQSVFNRMTIFHLVMKEDKRNRVERASSDKGVTARESLLWKPANAAEARFSSAKMQKCRKRPPSIEVVLGLDTSSESSSDSDDFDDSDVYSAAALHDHDLSRIKPLSKDELDPGGVLRGYLNVDGDSGWGGRAYATTKTYRYICDCVSRA